MEIYYAYFHSKINYGIEVYGVNAKKYLKRKEVLQHKALKILFDLDPLTTSLYLYKKYNVLSVIDQYTLNTAKLIHKYANKRLPDLFHAYFCYNSTNYPNTRHRNN